MWRHPGNPFPDEIAELRVEIERLLDALTTIAQSTPQNLDAEMLRVIAKAALAGKEGT